MDNRSNLTPTPIVDKNGVSSIRHMKHPTTIRMSMKVPAPVVAESVRRFDNADRVAKIIDGLVKAESKGGFNNLRKNLLRYPDEFLPEIERVVAGGDIVAHGVVAQVFAGTPQVRIEETLFFYPRVGIDSYYAVARLVGALPAYRHFPHHDDLRQADDELQDSYVALVKVTYALCDIPSMMDSLYSKPDHPLKTISLADSSIGAGVILNDDSLIQLVTERKHEIDRVAAIVREHATADPTVIRGILNGVTPSLAEGHL